TGKSVLQFALDAGLGGRNPQGFGMIEVAGK
ncbi:CRISPR-associated endoribonuclease Cas6, partial [Candidatus Aerophobetes bacterium]|nr:CRISPR-associated endoribonuclease Cas6 [Candidatus Aerophobetes bacterium]